MRSDPLARSGRSPKDPVSAGVARVNAATRSRATGLAGAGRGYVSRALKSPQGHAATFVGLWIYSALLIFQPTTLFPQVAVLGRFTLVVALATLVTYLISQVNLEGRLSTLTWEVCCLLALCFCVLVSIAWSVDAGASVAMFFDSLAKIVAIFFVMINAVRTEKRLLWLLNLVLGAAVFLSWGAIGAFRRGEFAVEGYRVEGTISGALHDPNDAALFLVTMLPIAIALLLSARRWWAKGLYGIAIAFMLATVFVTYSRGGFLALSFSGLFLVFKLYKRSPVYTTATLVLGLLLGIAVLPPNYATRLVSIVDPSRDPHATSDARRDLLTRSLKIASENPVVGVGMGNFHLFSIRNQVSHNSYTQIASEMGWPAMLVYLAFVTSPLWRMRRVERETWGASFGHEGYKRLHLLSVALQASVIGYMVGSFFLSVAYYWFVYYLVGYAVCVGRIYETGPGRIVGTYELGTRW